MSGVPIQVVIYAAAAAALFGMALYGLAMQHHLLRRILALNVLSVAVFLLLVSLARRDMTGDPDPVAHALVLTGIVVAVSTTALGLILMRRIHEVTGSATLPNERAEDD